MPLPLSKMALSTDAAENVALFYVKEGPVNPDDNTDNKPKVHDIGDIEYIYPYYYRWYWYNNF